MLPENRQRSKRRCSLPCCTRGRRFALLMPRCYRQRQEHFILNQRQYRQRLFGCYRIRTVIDQIVIRPLLPRRHQLQTAADGQQKPDAAKTTLATQLRLARDIHLQPRLALLVPPSFQANRQRTLRCNQNIRQARQLIHADTAFQHTAAARKLKTINDCSANRIRHSQPLARQKRRMLSCPTLLFQV